MLDTCPPKYSCGTVFPIWIDKEAPEDVLSPATVNVYSSASTSGPTSSNCKYITYPVEVMRCSLDTDYDLIYRYIGDYTTQTCARAFCGMN